MPYVETTAVQIAIFVILTHVTITGSLSFDEEPVDTIRTVGDDAQLNCSFLDWNSEPLTWTKEGPGGYGISFEDNVYRDNHYLVDDYGTGAYSLRIVNTTVARDGVYRCEVFTDKSIRSTAELYIMDDSPECGVAPGSTVIAGDITHFNCSINKAVPPGTLVWRMDGEPVASESDSLIHEWSTSFDRTQHGSRLACALEYFTLSESLSCEDIEMDVQYAPLVTSQLTGDVSQSGEVIEGKSFVAECIVLDSNPEHDNITWFDGDTVIGSDELVTFDTIYRSEAGNYVCVAGNTYWNGQRGENETYITVDVQYLDNVTIVYENDGKVIEGEVYTTQCLSHSNPGADFKWYDSDGVLVGTEATLTLDGVHRDDSGVLTCVGNIAFWDGSSELSNSTMTLDVQYISDAVISDNSDGKVIDGQRYYANCSVDANPPGSMYWITPNGTVIDDEQLVIEAAERTDAGNYTCGANVTFWDGTEKHAQSVIHIDVQYSPNVTITDSTDGKAIEEGSYQAICHAQGNPDPDIIWYDDDGDMVMTGPDLVIDDISKENSGEYTCQANNTFWNGDQGTANETIFVDVQYISIPVVYSANDGLVIEGQPYYANCTVESNPSGIVFWLTPNLNVSEGAIVEIEETDRTDTGNYTCMGETTYWDGSVGRRDKTIYVGVQYVPDVDNGHVVYKEGEDTVLPCVVDANPEPHSHAWQREGVIISEGPTLIIDNCSRTDAANYTCTAVNGFYDGSQGIGEGTVGLVVEYLPQVNLTVLPQTTLMEGESVILQCQYIDGLPTPYKLTLIFGADDDVLVEEEDGSALEYNISAVDRSQSGTYECRTTTLFYDSSEGHSSDNLELIVVYSATIVPEDIRTFEAEIGDTVTMDCTADGMPTPEITWYDEESYPILDGEENRKISMVIEGDRIISTLAVTVVSDFYYGEYTCKASNGISSDDTQHFQIVSLETGALNTDAIIIVTVTLGVLLLVAVTISVVLLVRRRKNGSATLNGGSELSIM